MATIQDVTKPPSSQFQIHLDEAELKFLRDAVSRHNQHTTGPRYLELESAIKGALHRPAS